MIRRGNRLLKRSSKMREKLLSTGIYGLTIIALTVILGCAATQIETFKDPLFEGKTYNTIMVFGEFSDLKNRKSVENKFCQAFGEKGINCVSSIDLIYPTREYGKEEIVKIVKENKIDAVLMVSLKDAYEKKIYMPGDSKTSCQANYYGNVDCHTYTSPSYYISKPRIKCESVLVDIERDKDVWMASSFTAGNAYADFEVMVISLARETLKKLSDDGLVSLTQDVQK